MRAHLIISFAFAAVLCASSTQAQRLTTPEMVSNVIRCNEQILAMRIVEAYQQSLDAGNEAFVKHTSAMTKYGKRHCNVVGAGWTLFIDDFEIVSTRTHVYSGPDTQQTYHIVKVGSSISAKGPFEENFLIMPEAYANTLFGKIL